jgi:hypothetical protein
MSQLVKHLKVSAIADGPDPNQVNPSDWNAAHVFSGGALGGLLMRDPGDATYGASWLASVAAGSVLISNGVGASPTWASSPTLTNLTLTGSLQAIGNGILAVRNMSATGRTDILIGNDAAATVLDIATYGSGYTSAGGYDLPNGTLFYHAGAGGMTFLTASAAAYMQFWTGGVKRWQLDPVNGYFSAGVASPYGQAHTVLGTGVVQIGNAGTATAAAMYFANANGIVGSITTTGTGTAYGTTSDARLKDDAGRASDVTALRAVVVHDFRWKADGVPARGVFAQEAVAVFPHAVSVGTDETTERGALAHPWMTDYSQLVPDLIVGWQQLDAEVAALRAALATLRR